jgi:methyl coenzyme M reductase beta subunit
MDEQALEKVMRMIADAIDRYDERQDRLKRDISEEQKAMHRENAVKLEKIISDHVAIRETLAVERGRKEQATKTNRLWMAFASMLGAGLMSLIVELVKNGLHH